MMPNVSSYDKIIWVRKSLEWHHICSGEAMVLTKAESFCREPHTACKDAGVLLKETSVQYDAHFKPSYRMSSQDQVDSNILYFKINPSGILS